MAGIFSNLTQFFMHKQHKNNYKENKKNTIEQKKDLQLQHQQNQDVWIKTKDNIPKETTECKIQWSQASNIRKISIFNYFKQNYLTNFIYII